MSQFLFGSGAVYATLLQDATGSAVSNPTPVKFLGCQDISIDTSFDTKTLYGQNQMPLSVGRGKGKVQVKIKHAQVNGAMYNYAFFGIQTQTSGQFGYYQDINGVAVATSITPSVPSGGAAWSADLGVRNPSGVPMTRVASAPAVGQYSVSAGVYTFNSTDATTYAGLKFYIDFRYTITATGNQIAVQSQLLGSTPLVSLDVVVPFGGKQFTFKFPQATAGKLSVATKLDDYAIPALDFECFADATGNIYTIGIGE
jgi:hypothetical protein